MSARRPLLTAAAAGSLLCALWFVPSANATAERTGTADRTPASSHTGARSGEGSVSASGANLADTGSVDVTPYLVGGTAFLGLGLAMVTASVRRARPEAY